MKSAAQALALKRRRERIDRFLNTIKVRECLVYDLVHGYVLRYDFAYQDPSSKWFKQYGTTGFWIEPPTNEQLLDARDMNKRMIAYELERTCGIDQVKPLPMFMPRGVEARMV